MTLDFESLPLKEIRKGRELCWDPHAIDLTQDAKDWSTLSDVEKELLLSQVFGFLVGERAVTHDLAPLQQALRLERSHMEEEMYLTQQLSEEATHVEFFQRWLYEALPGELGKDVPYPRGERSKILSQNLPEAMNALHDDPSPKAQMRAVVVYHQIVEGVLAELGYQIFYDSLQDRGIFPGLLEGVRHIQIDESRHIAFGTYLAQRLIRDFPELKDFFVEEMERQLPDTLRSAEALFEFYEEPVPFGLDRKKLVDLGKELYRRRVKAVLSGGLVAA